MPVPCFLSVPEVAYDQDQLLESLYWIEEERNEGVRIFYGHDPEFWKTVPQAPLEIR